MANVFGHRRDRVQITAVSVRVYLAPQIAGLHAPQFWMTDGAPLVISGNSNAGAQESAAITTRLDTVCSVSVIDSLSGSLVSNLTVSPNSTINDQYYGFCEQHHHGLPLKNTQMRTIRQHPGWWSIITQPLGGFFSSIQEASMRIGLFGAFAPGGGGGMAVGGGVAAAAAPIAPADVPVGAADVCAICGHSHLLPHGQQVNPLVRRRSGEDAAIRIAHAWVCYLVYVCPFYYPNVSFTPSRFISQCFLPPLGLHVIDPLYRLALLVDVPATHLAWGAGIARRKQFPARLVWPRAPPPAVTLPSNDWRGLKFSQSALLTQTNSQLDPNSLLEARIIHNIQERFDIIRTNQVNSPWLHFVPIGEQSRCDAGFIWSNHLQLGQAFSGDQNINRVWTCFQLKTLWWRLGHQLRGLSIPDHYPDHMCVVGNFIFRLVDFNFQILFVENFLSIHIVCVFYITCCLRLGSFFFFCLYQDDHHCNYRRMGGSATC